MILEFKENDILILKDIVLQFMIGSYNNSGFIILLLILTKVTLLKACISMIEYSVHSAIFTIQNTNDHDMTFDILTSFYFYFNCDQKTS